MRIKDADGHVWDFYELPNEWERVLRQMYRALRIRVGEYPETYERNPELRYEGHFYGKSRREAKDHMSSFLDDLNWLIYLGSK